MDNSLLGIAEELTPERAAIMKLEAAAEFDGDFEEPATPSGKRKSLGFSGMSNGNYRSALTRSGRHVSTSSRRSSSFMSLHRNKMSMELTTQAESKFLSLMELMAGAGREAASLKDYWGRLSAEREAFMREKEEMQIQIDEVTETLQQTQEQHHDHSHELHERKREVEKLRLELTTVLGSVAEQRKKFSDREHELDRARQELSEVRLTISRSLMENETIKAELDTLRLKYSTCEGERDSARESSEKYHGELRILTREHTDLKSKNADILLKLESGRKEILSLTDRIKIWEMEREEHLHERDYLNEELRKVKARAEDAARELSEVTERFEKSQRDVTKLRDSLRIIESERDDYAHTIEQLRRDLKTRSTDLDEAEARCADITLKYEHIKREVVTIKDKLRDVESENGELRLSVETKQEEYRLVIIERDQIKDDLEVERQRVHDGARQISVLQDSLTRTELTLSEVRTELVTLTERIKTLEIERDDHRGKHGSVAAEVAGLKERIVLLQAEIRIVTDARDKLRKEVAEHRRKYEEVTETITEFQDGSGELEFEIESLRTMLRETREQKERAISARNAADRERDEFVAKYEEKCREMERYEEESARFFHMHSSGGGMRSSSTRVISRNGASSSSLKRQESIDA